MSNYKPSIGKILGATILAPDLEKVIQPYVTDLDYKIVNRGNVSEKLAKIWNASEHIDAETVILSPESSNPPWIRFVQAKPVNNYKAMTTFGWHSLEINVQDVDKIPQKLKNSSFKIIGQPHNLGMSSSIRAMQVVGLAEEVLYLTQIPTDGTAPHLPNAETFIDRIFIVPLGSPNMDRTRSWYMDQFSNIEKGMEARDIEMKLIANALNIDSKTKCSICTIRLPNKGSIEIDDYPSQATPRPKNKNSLPPGIATVTFAVNSLAKVAAPFISDPVNINESPYNQSKVGAIVGDASEIIELVEI